MHLTKHAAQDDGEDLTIVLTARLQLRSLTGAENFAKMKMEQLHGVLFSFVAVEALVGKISGAYCDTFENNLKPQSPQCIFCT